MKGFYLLILFSLMASCSQNGFEETASLNQKIPPIFTLKNTRNSTLKNDTLYINNRKYSGFLLELQDNNVDTLSKVGYYNGLQSGISKKWFPNKKTMEIRHYSGGKKNGKQLAFWDNGYKKFEFVAKEDIYEGELKEWNMEGRLIHLANYKNGQEEGTQKLWYDNGKIRANYVIIKGKRYGLLGTKNCMNVSDSIFNLK